MGQINLSDYRSLYLQTAKDYLNNLSSGYSKLSVDAQDRESINMIHISSHSLKSQSQVMGFTDIASISFSLEKSSNDVLSGTAKVDETFLAFLKKSVDDIGSELSKIEQQKP